MAADEAVAADAAEHIAALFRAEYTGLVRTASLIVGDVPTAEEIVQDAFVSLQLSWPRLRDPARAPGWLRAAVVNGSRSRLRRVAVRRRHDRADSLAAPSADVGALAASEHRTMVAALSTLPPRQREALVLRFYLDLSEADTASAMGVSAGSVKTHVHRGLAALHSLLEDSR